MSSIRLQVMICTYGHNGLSRVGHLNLPKVKDVGYLISCQNEPIELPQTLVRDDVKVVFTPTKGLSNNRNNALDNADAEFVLIADDDLTFYPEGLEAIIKAFDENPEIDIATFRCDYPYKVIYPDKKHDLNVRYKGYVPSSCEIALRLSSIRRAGIRFSPLLGIGAPYLQAAEESFMLMACQRKGLKGCFFPITIVSHPYESTGVRNASRKQVLRANGAYILNAYPGTMALRIPLVAYRRPGNTLRNIYHLLWGAVYALRNRKRLLNP